MNFNDKTVIIKAFVFDFARWNWLRCYFLCYTLSGTVKKVTCINKPRQRHLKIFINVLLNYNDFFKFYHVLNHLSIAVCYAACQ